MRYDVIVVGGGPAGATAAHALALGSARVLLLERRKVPRYKACGGCLSRRVERLLGFELGHLVEEEITGFTLTYRGRDPIEAAFGEPMAYMVWRDRFDHALCMKAVEAGATLRDGRTVRAAQQVGNRVELDLEGTTEIADFVIGADGAAGIVARDLFPDRPHASAVGLDAELPFVDGKTATLRGRVVIEFGRAPGGYCWAFPKRGVASVGAMVGRGAARQASECLLGFLGAGGFGDQKADRTHGALIPLYASRGVLPYRGRALLAGDAAALVDPFLGEGIYYAIQSGQFAARAILRAAGDGGDLRWYEQAISTEIVPELLAAGWLSRLVHRLPWLWFKGLKRRRGAIGLLRKVLMGEENYQSFVGRVVAETPRPLRFLLGARHLRGSISGGMSGL